MREIEKEWPLKEVVFLSLVIHILIYCLIELRCGS